jgi:hypothetical protein
MGAGVLTGKHAGARAFLRVDGDHARLAIQIAIEEEFHLYHGPTAADLGKGITGSPTTFAITGGNIEWGPVVYPEPIELVQPAFGPNEPSCRTRRTKVSSSSMQKVRAPRMRIPRPSASRSTA